MALPSASTADSDLHLPTPTIDSESSALLHIVSEHGGYAYVSMASRAAAGDVRAAEAAREMAWEQPHSGPWHSILPVWRDAYAMACLHVAKLHFAAGEFSDALRALDMGLLMGGPLFKSDLHAAVRKVSPKSSTATAARVSEGNGPNLDRRLVRDDLKASEMVGVLPPKSLSCKMVVKKSDLSLEGFLREHFLPGSPVILTDCMGHWPARTKWNDMDYLLRVAGDRTVPVEVGKNYLYPEWKQELIMFSQFLERIRGTDSSSGVPTYLAQHLLFDQINELREDICIPDYCCAGGGELRSTNAWFGPAGTITPLHHDPHHNVFAQVVGKKYIRLYCASLSEELYPHTETMLCNSSQVDLDNIDEKEFPKVQDLEFLDCILEEGDMLYIPPKWWHYVRSLTTSMSVSFWWSDYDGSATS